MLFRSPVYAKGKEVPGISKKHSLSLPVVRAILEEDTDETDKVVTPHLVEEEETAAV